MITNDIFEINRRVCFDLWNMNSVKEKDNFKYLAPRLIYPIKRDEMARISEQESKLLYCNILNNTSYFYSIETPTEKSYQFTGNSELSARTDLTIYQQNEGIFERLVNVEFKAHNQDEKNFIKDIEKLLREGLTGNWFHTLKNIDSRTLPNIFEKMKNSFQKMIASIDNKVDISVVFCYCVFEKGWACLKHFDLEANDEPEGYIDSFFKLDYSIKASNIIVNDAKDWIIIENK